MTVVQFSKIKRDVTIIFQKGFETIFQVKQPEYNIRKNGKSPNNQQRAHEQFGANMPTRV